EIEPEAAFSMFLSQFIYDLPDDATGIYSAMRGQSLSRNMYGLNLAALNDKPYSGTGRLHGPTAPGFSGVASTEAALMNFMCFPTDGFIHDPERPGLRALNA